MFSVSQEKIENINETNYARMGQKTIFIPDYLSEKLHKILSAENMNYLSVDRDDGKDSVAFIFESKKEADRAISFINILENEIEGNYRQHTVEIPKGMRMQVQDLLPSKLGYSIFESLDNPDKLDLMFSLKEDAEYFTSFVKKGKLENITEDGQYYIGRSYMDVPSEDGVIYVKYNSEYMINEYVNVKIVDYSEYDLFGKIDE